MSDLLKGTISNALGLRNVLEQVTSMKEVNSGILTVSAETASGRLGIAWGRFITGALLDTGESGRPALRRLLTAREGTFVFVDTNGEPVDELRQSLGIDLNGVVPYVPEEITLAVTPWLFDSAEQTEANMEIQAAEQVEDKADRVLAQLQQVIGSGQTGDEPADGNALPPNVIELIATAQSAVVEAPIDHTRDMQPMPVSQVPPAQPGAFIPDAARFAPLGGDAAARAQKQRAAGHQGGDTVGIAILCVLFFVVSCAGTVIIGPRIAAVVTSAFHATH